ncbi:MAG: family 16 glycosylhydrolase, partial [Chlorobi bacterium]|nr:family 16 glycosylhydrolase [Chlorobiota bacterium]
EFDGNQVDVSKWYTCEDGWSRTSDDSLAYILDNNTSVNNGVLEITAKYQPDYYEVAKFDENGNPYTENEFFSSTSGMIQSKMNFKYGLFEAMVWIPEGKALWPSFWLWGPYGYQNIGTEIDIFEFKTSNQILTKQYIKVD